MSTMMAFVSPVAPPAPQTRGAQAYLATQVQSRSPLELVVLLYDGAVRFLGQARDAMLVQDLVAKRDALSKGTAILCELQSMLNMEEGGEIAERLDALYTYVQGRCLAANVDGDPAPLDEAIRLLGTLRSAWAEVAGPPPPAA